MNTPGPASIDLNADLGEGYGAWSMGDDAAMLEVVTTANIACGGHAGDPSSMRRAVTAAKSQYVAITAHVSYPDLQGFGRRFLDIAPAELTDHVIAQVGALRALAATSGARVRGIKPHGALYNALAHHREQADAVLTAIDELGGSLPLVAAPGSQVTGCAETAGVRTFLEGFADRAYTPDGTLLPRREPGAVLTEPAAVAEQALAIATERRVRAIDGSWIDLPAHTLCLHGDTAGAVALAREVRSRLEAEGIILRTAL